MGTAHQRHLEVVRLLLEAGADHNAAEANETTALMAAAFNGHLKVVRLLLEAGADQNAATQDGTTVVARGECGRALCRQFATAVERMVRWKW